MRNEQVAITFGYTKCPLDLAMDVELKVNIRSILEVARARHRSESLDCHGDPFFESAFIAPKDIRDTGGRAIMTVQLYATATYTTQTMPIVVSGPR